METSIKTFKELTVSELYDLLHLRSEVFIVEQDCVYPDVDGKDRKALHIIGKKEKKIIAYARCFKAGDYLYEASIGRVVVEESQRKFNHGHEIMNASIEAIKAHFNTETIFLSAQCYLTGFYETHGFKLTGKEFLEDGIPHILMVKK